MDIKWFKEVFLPSFEIGKEIRIFEKQFLIFEEHLPHDKKYGLDYIVYGNVDDLYVEASKLAGREFYLYYLTIKKLNRARIPKKEGAE